MIISPKVRGFICTNAHPQGCAANIQQQIDYIRSKAPLVNDHGQRPLNVLVIGASTGYGMASRITAAFGYSAKTIGVFYEKPPTERKTASAGYYNAAAFDAAARESGLYAKSINGDAFSNSCKQKTIDLIKADLGQVDLVIYSLASPRRTDPDTGEVYTSTLKPIGKSYTAKNLNTDNQVVGEITVEPATEKEIADTIKVMGGKDWQLWLKALADANALANNVKTVAYTYLGEKLTWPIYGHATIGKAKEDLDRAARELRNDLSFLNGSAHVAVLKAVVTQASSAIPVMPLYLAILFKVMQEAGTHEGCIEQLYRLYTECLYNKTPQFDNQQRMRVDNLELDPEIQAKVEMIWPQVTTENLHELSDFALYHTEFLRLFGFGIGGVDYSAETTPLVTAEFL